MKALAAEGFTTIAPDMRGFGYSDVPKKLEDYSADLILKDVLCLLDFLGVEKAVFVGHDWGGHM